MFYISEDDGTLKNIWSFFYVYKNYSDFWLILNKLIEDENINFWFWILWDKSSFCSFELKHFFCSHNIVYYRTEFCCSNLKIFEFQVHTFHNILYLLQRFCLYILISDPKGRSIIYKFEIKIALQRFKL